MPNDIDSMVAGAKATLKDANTKFPSPAGRQSEYRNVYNKRKAPAPAAAPSGGDEAPMQWGAGTAAVEAAGGKLPGSN
jgi:hypothetical protein